MNRILNIIPNGLKPVVIYIAFSPETHPKWRGIVGEKLHTTTTVLTSKYVIAVVNVVRLVNFYRAVIFNLFNIT